MDIHQYHEVCRKIDEEGKAEIDVKNKKGEVERVVVTEYLSRMKQFAFKEDRDRSAISFRNAFIVANEDSSGKE